MQIKNSFSNYVKGIFVKPRSLIPDPSPGILLKQDIDHDTTIYTWKKFLSLFRFFKSLSFFLALGVIFAFLDPLIIHKSHLKEEEGGKETLYTKQLRNRSTTEM